MNKIEARETVLALLGIKHHKDLRDTLIYAKRAPILTYGKVKIKVMFEHYSRDSFVIVWKLDADYPTSWNYFTETRTGLQAIDAIGRLIANHA